MQRKRCDDSSSVWHRRISSGNVRGVPCLPVLPVSRPPARLFGAFQGPDLPGALQSPAGVTFTVPDDVFLLGPTAGKTSDAGLP